MLSPIPADARFAADLGSMQAYFLFSFAHYYDADNLNFGPLRVLNDFTLAPRGASPLHPHAEVEIVTLVLEGALTYTDATDTDRLLPAGHGLRLTGGTGLHHAEANRGSTPARALELWFAPSQAGFLPAQEQKALDFLARANEWLPLASGRGDGGAHAIFLNCDATVWWAALRPGATLAYAPDDTEGPRQLLLYVVGGSATVNGTALAGGAHLRLPEPPALTLYSAGGAQVLLIDLPA